MFKRNDKKKKNYIYSLRFQFFLYQKASLPSREVYYCGHLRNICYTVNCFTSGRQGIRKYLSRYISFFMVCIIRHLLTVKDQYFHLQLVLLQQQAYGICTYRYFLTLQPTLLVLELLQVKYNNFPKCIIKHTIRYKLNKFK